jgi:hypothetical protein
MFPPGAGYHSSIILGFLIITLNLFVAAMKKLFLSLVLLLSFSGIFSQPAPEKSDLRKDALKVFMNANDYIRKEIPYVNYMRDIKDAGVYIITTSQRTGSGGFEQTFYLIGQNEYSGMADTISFVTTPDDTQESIRAKEVRTLKMGLMRYVARTPLAEYMHISFTEDIPDAVPDDKWNSWVFRTAFNGWSDGQQTYKSINLNSNISASRITQDLKINLNSWYNYGKQVFEIDEDLITSQNYSKGINTLLVRSVTDHWSYGGSASLASSSYNNEKLKGVLMPGIEYDMFPYSESTRRQLRLLYSAGYVNVQYSDSTIFDKMKEGHFLHSANLGYEVLQKWGSIDLNMRYSNYLHDWSKNNVSFNGHLNLRIARGISMNVGGGASLIHDQLGLVKSGASTEEILLRRKEVATQFQHYANFGFSYTFGSIYNNVVNPRFGN